MLEGFNVDVEFFPADELLLELEVELVVGEFVECGAVVG